MMQLDPNNVRYDSVEARRTDGKRYEIAFALRKKRLMLQVPSGLVVSSDDEVRRKLAQVLRQCAIAPVLASTVAESEMVLAGHESSVVVCNDRMDDGKYEDIVKLAVRCVTKVPVIVVSRTGDWPEYLRATCGGAFDYLVYPPIPGDLQETIKNALLRQQRHGNGRNVAIKPVAVLLVGEGARNPLQPLQWLNQLGYGCHVAESCRDACNLVSRRQFDRSTSCLASSNYWTEQLFRCWTGLKDLPRLCFSPRASRTALYG
jgi:CheY-like chemotaxis protein